MVCRSSVSRRRLLAWIGITSSKYHDWRCRRGEPNRHNGRQPRSHWLRPWEHQAILDFCRGRLDYGYRRLTYMMLDADICAVSPATTYRVLKSAGLLQRWAPTRSSTKGTGFEQPVGVNEHWHIDISIVSVQGTRYNLISILDGYSRKIVAHDLRVRMEYEDVALVLQRAAEAYPDAKPRMISDNGGQFIAHEFKDFIAELKYTHVRTSPGYPQSNGKLERFHGTIKQEAVRKQSYVNLQDARQQLAGYVAYYNQKRLHSAIHYLAPDDVFNGRSDELLAIRDDKLYRARQQRRRNAAVGT